MILHNLWYIFTYDHFIRNPLSFFTLWTFVWNGLDFPFSDHFVTNPLFFPCMETSVPYRWVALWWSFPVLNICDVVADKLYPPPQLSITYLRPVITDLSTCLICRWLCLPSILQVMWTIIILCSPTTRHAQVYCMHKPQLSHKTLG